MSAVRRHIPLCTILATAVLLFPAAPPQASAGGKVGLYGIYMVPNDADAKDYSRPGFGGGIHAVLPVPAIQNLIAGVVGLEVVNLLSKTISFQDRVTGLRVDQETSQNYYRFYLGAQAGGHGNGFLRPHAGASLALIFYSISTDVVVPDDYNRENEIRQNLRGQTKTSLGYDLNMGLDLNFSNTIALDVGVKYLTSFSVPEQLADAPVTVHPKYFQVYLGIGASFDMLSGAHAG